LYFVCGRLSKPGKMVRIRGRGELKNRDFYGFWLQILQDSPNLEEVHRRVGCAPLIAARDQRHLRSYDGLSTLSVFENKPNMNRRRMMNCQMPPRVKLIVFAMTSILGSGAMDRIATAQDECCFEPSYRLQCETVMQPQTVQRFRISYETEMVPEQVTSMRPVLRTRVEEREYKVARPIVETSFREERFTVWKPVVETTFRDETFQQTRMVQETAEREEQVTSFHPVVETQFQQQQFMVQRPVVETQFVNQQFTVQRPVVETQMQTQQFTSLRPVTSVQNQTVDMGGFVPQQTVTPGQVQMALAWGRSPVFTPGPLGIFARRRPVVGWTPVVTPPTVQTQLAYRPNLVTQQVATTQLVQETQAVQVPVQVQRMQTEVVNQQVPVQVQRMQMETVTQNVPVQTTRMVPTTTVRKVPFIVQRPVTETVTRKVPVTQQRWVTEEQVRKVPVQTTRMTYETRREPVTVNYYEQEAVVQTVMKPVTRQVCVPYNETVMVPKQVVQRMPLSYYDPFSPAIVNGYSSFSAPLSSSPTVATPIERGSSVVTQPQESNDHSSYAAPKSSSDKPSTELKRIERGPLEEPQQSGGEESERSILEPEPMDPDDADELPAPEMNPPQNEADDSVEASEAGWRIEWTPRFARSI
jgi:hypothetical protein